MNSKEKKYDIESKTSLLQLIDVLKKNKALDLQSSVRAKIDAFLKTSK